MDCDEVLDELVVRLADVAALPLVRAEDLVVVERVVDHRETCRGNFKLNSTTCFMKMRGLCRNRLNQAHWETGNDS